jgi:hypothetical protein
MTHIDVRSALRASVQGPYSDLVTRPTGAAVRMVVEHQIAGLADGTVVFLDFSHIGILDRSCADEFVAKLLLPMTSAHPAHDGYVVINGLTEDHLEQIEAVLNAHDLALVVQLPGGPTRLVGMVTDAERRCWELVMQQGATQGATPAAAIASGTGLATEDCQQLLDGLARRRLLRRDAKGFAPLGAAA